MQANFAERKFFGPVWSQSRIDAEIHPKPYLDYSPKNHQKLIDQRRYFGS
jgi:hypothetical protein